MKQIQTCLVVVLLLIFSSAFAQIDVPNAGFEEKDNTTPTRTAVWMPEGAPAFCAVDSTAPYKGMYCLKLTSVSATELNFFRGEFDFSSPGVRKYRLRCAIRTQDLRGSAGIGARVLDIHGNSVTFAYKAVTVAKNQAWQLADLIFYANEDAARIRLFGRVEGTGTAWFDAFTMAEIASYDAVSEEVTAYIDEYFRIVKEHSVVQVPEYIERLKIETLQLCGGSENPADCHAVLKGYTTLLLKDGHSFFSTPADWKEMNSESKMKEQGLIHLPSGKMLENDIAYIEVPTFVSKDPKVIAQYADTLQNIIARYDTRQTRGWIIDLSKNSGGNSFPMLAGIGPLIGDGVAGYSVSPGGSMMKRIYRDGWTGWDSTLVFQKRKPVRLSRPGLPVAVIYGKQTGSSGEVTAISFIGLTYARSFGQSTAGANTRIDNFKLSDGAWLNLAAGYNADRNKNVYTASLTPDKATDSYEEAMEEAVKWILGREAGEE